MAGQAEADPIRPWSSLPARLPWESREEVIPVGTIVKVALGVVLGVATLVGLFLLWLGWKWGQISDEVGRFSTFCPPLRLKIEPVSDSDWDDQGTVEEIQGHLESAGFQQAGFYQAYLTAPISIQAFVHPDQDAYGCLYELAGEKVWLDLFSCYPGDASFTTTSGEPDGLPRAREQALFYCHELSFQEQIAAFFRERPEVGAYPASRQSFQRALEGKHAQHMDWLVRRGDLTLEEVEAIVEAEGRQLDTVRMKELQTHWHEQMNLGLEGLLKNVFLAETTLSAAQWEEVRDTVLFIHERLTPEEVVESFLNYSKEETDSEPHRLSLIGLVEEADSRRQGFHRLNARLAPNQAYRKLGEVSTPIPADVYGPAEN
jgi:hypothetical protein